MQGFLIGLCYIFSSSVYRFITKRVFEYLGIGLLMKLFNWTTKQLTYSSNVKKHLFVL